MAAAVEASSGEAISEGSRVDRPMSIDVSEGADGSQAQQSMADLDQLEALHMAAAEDIDDALQEYRTKGTRRAAKKRKLAILTVFLEGTANTINPPTTQVGLFAAACVATDISIEAPTPDSPSSESLALFKMMFDGCGVSHGVGGLLFGSGLRGQADRVRAALLDLVGIYGSPVRCNVLGANAASLPDLAISPSFPTRGRDPVPLGLSRGGIAAIYLAQGLGDLPAGTVELNLLAFDPVPGDQTWSGFPYTGAYARDCGDCKCLERRGTRVIRRPFNMSAREATPAREREVIARPKTSPVERKHRSRDEPGEVGTVARSRRPGLKRVLALYPHEPLPDITFHAPVLVKWPDGARVEEDVTLGCHQGALFATRRSAHPVHVASNLAFRRVVNFLEECGTKLALDRCFGYQPSDEDCLRICRATLGERDKPTRRHLHDGCNQGRVIVRRKAGVYLNKYHLSLEGPVETVHEDLLTPIQDDGGEPPDGPGMPKPKFMLDIDAPLFQRSCGW